MSPPKNKSENDATNSNDTRNTKEYDNITMDKDKDVTDDVNYINSMDKEDKIAFQAE